MTDAAVSESPASGELASTAETNGAPKINPITLLVGTIIRPAATFRQLREAKHGYWWFVLLVTIVMIAAVALASSSAQMRALESFVVTDGGKSGAVTSGQIPNRAAGQSGGDAAPVMVQSGVSVALIVLPLIGGTLVTLLDYVLRALIVFLMSMLLGGKAAFKEVFRMAAWTTLPAAIRRLIQAIAVAVTGGQVAAGFSAALTAAEIRTLPLVNLLLGYIDLYTLWSILLLGIGAAITGKLSRGKAAFTVAIYLGVSLVGILVFFAVTNAIAGAFGGPQGPGGPRGGGGGRIRIGG